MHSSLSQHCSDFHLFVFAFDDLAYHVLVQLALPHVTVISLNEFEDEELRRIKPSRNKGEYCWTCTPSTIKYCIEKFRLDHCTYLDADLYFYENPVLIVEELFFSKKEVLITKHNYAANYDQSETSGIYCVQFMIFKNTKKSMEVLNWWRNACIDWCYAKCENGKFGDQKYLDDWTTRYNGIHVSQQLGVGVAPWNACRFKLIKQSNQKLSVKLIEDNVVEQKLIFYHFHGFRIFENRAVWGIGYFLPKDFIENIYKPYTNLLLMHFDFIRQTNPNIPLPIKGRQKSRTILLSTIFFLKDILRFFFHKLKRTQYRSISNTYHIYKIKNGKLIRY
jgi:hypothetical protein